jgi:hypothetical protein
MLEFPLDVIISMALIFLLYLILSRVMPEQAGLFPLLDFQALFLWLVGSVDSELI